MSVKMRVLSEDDFGRTVEETFTEGGKVACVSVRYELNDPPPPAPSIAGLRDQLAAAGTDPGALVEVLGGMLDVLDPNVPTA